MAKKKQNPNQLMEPTIDEQMAINSAEALDAKTRLLEVQTMENDAKIMKQEAENKAHDVELTQFGGATDSEEEVDEGVLAPMHLDNITDKDVETAYDTLMKYKANKADIEKRIEENEEFWKMRHWEVMYKAMNMAEDKRIKPKSAWLVNTIINKHADAMDNYPEATILPRARDDEETAKVLGEIIPVVLERNEYENTYSDCQWYKAKNGTSVQAVLWNNDKENGLGDIEIKKVDVLNLYWKSGVTDIQDSPNVFYVQMLDINDAKERYPDLNDKVVGGNLPVSTMDVYKENVDDTEMVAVIDWYYKKRIVSQDEHGIPLVKTLLHYCKFCNGHVIYASENDPNYVDRGWYDHGLYPFVFDTLFPVEQNLCGLGWIDISKDNQLYIDKLQQAILESAMVNARPRWAVRQDSNINESEFLDLSKPIVHFEGNLGEGSYAPITGTPLSGLYETIYLNKVSEMKETSGNTASSQGATSSVTSASGIAALQEAAGKLSRDANKASYRSYKQVVNLVIELMRQFYNEPRVFRIAGEYDHNEYVTFDNTGLKPQEQGNDFGVDLGVRLPILDIDVKPQKKNPYSKETQNQTALNLYQMGFFAPTNADASLACLEMMDFDGVEKMKEEVSKNGTLMQLVVQMQQQMQAYQQQLIQLGVIVDAQQGTDIAPQVASEAQGTAQEVQSKVEGSARNGKGSKPNVSRGSLSSQAAQASRNSTAPSQ